MNFLESWRFVRGEPGNFKVADVGRGGKVNVYEGRDLATFRAHTPGHRHTHTVIDNGRTIYSRDYFGRVKVGTARQRTVSLRKELLAKTAISQTEAAGFRALATDLRTQSASGTLSLSKISSSLSLLEARNATLAQQLSGLRGKVSGPKFNAAHASLRASVEATRTARALTEKAVRLERAAAEAASKSTRAQAELAAKSARVQAELAAKTARAQAEAAAKASRQAAEAAAKTGRAAAEATGRSLRATAEAALKTARATAEAAAKAARAAAEAAVRAARVAAEATAKAAAATATAVASAVGAMLGG